MDNETMLIIAAVVVAVLVIAAVIWFVMRSRNGPNRELKSVFESEYDRTVDAHGDRQSAEQELRERRIRVEGYELRDLDEREHSMFTEEWQRVRATFVDQPAEAIGKADLLLVEVMRARGYEGAELGVEHRAADMSVGHGDEAEDYREARRIAERSRRGESGTEDLRQAMLHFERVFDALLDPASPRPSH